MATKKTEIKIKPLTRALATVRIIGDTPLVVHKWSEKGKRMLPAGKRAASVNGIADKEDYDTPVEAFMNSIYWITEKPKEYTMEAFSEAVQKGARFGFKADSIKKAALSGAYAKKWIPNKKNINGLFFVKPDYVNEQGEQLVEIKCENVSMREDIVILSGMSRTSDLRWRPQFNNWHIDLMFDYDIDGIYTLEDIVNMINVGGYYFGLGEMRPEKGGQYGMFHVEATEKKRGKK